MQNDVMSEDEEFVKAFQDADRVAKEVTGLLVQTRQTIVRLKTLSIKLQPHTTEEEKKALDLKEKEISERFERVTHEMTAVLSQLDQTRELQGLFFRLVAMQGVMSRVTQLHHEIEITVDGIQDRVSESGFDDIGTDPMEEDPADGENNE